MRHCRACNEGTIKVMSLGDFWVSDFPKVWPRTGGIKAPLELMRCHRCGLIQLTETVPREKLYREYWYKSGINESMVLALRDVVDNALGLVNVAANDSVLDIGANDGTLLDQYALGVHKVAVEPADNLVPILRAKFSDRRIGEVVHGYFPTPRSQDLLGLTYNHQGFKVITAIAMFYDLEDPLGFVREIQRVLHKDGIWIVQMGDLESMLDTRGLDTVCHEHLEYWSLGSFMHLLSKVELQVLDVAKNQVNGGSLRIIVGHRNSKVPMETGALGRIREICASEEGLLTTNEPYLDFDESCRNIRDRLKQRLQEYRTIDVYGASTKGNTLLQYLNLGPAQIRQAVERSPEKVGRYTVTGIPIVSEEKWRRDLPEATLVNIWQFKDAVLQRERAQIGRTAFIFPLPAVEVIET